jgi:pyruvate/2-oxoglutarate dehydrogenase complex dihydrolipoamide acyltransferase (E2) component
MPVNLGVGDLLAEAGDLTVRRLSRASTWQKTHGGTIERALLSTGAVSEETLTAALSQAYALPGVSRATLLSADPDIVECLAAKERRRFRAFPFSLSGKILNVAISDPQNIVLQKNLSIATGFSVEIFVAPDPVLEDVIEKFEGAPAGHAPSPASTAPASAAPAPAAAPAHAAVAPPDGDWIDRLGRALLAEALRFDATELELGADTHGAFLRTFDTAHPAVTRRLSTALLAPLVGWFQGRCRRAEGFVAEAAVPGAPATRRRVDLIAADSHGVRVRLVPVGDGVELPAPARLDVSCAHEQTDGFVFCPRCGAVL